MYIYLHFHFCIPIIDCVNGAIFVRKSPAATINTLVLALKDIFSAKNKVKIIGTRHGEKKHEVLLNREELFKAEQMGDYYKVMPDIRSLNYGNYFEQGDKPLSSEMEYSSDNTKRLNKDEEERLEKIANVSKLKEQRIFSEQNVRERLDRIFKEKMEKVLEEFLKELGGLD